MYFGCSAGNGKGNNLIVTCASDFAGITITCTNGVKTYSKVCPSSEPYEIEFSGLEAGTWTISGTVEGTLYSNNVVIADYTATLDSGFDYKTWCTEGGVDATQYSSLADVFADELAVHRLMTVHASADYLIEAVTDDIDVIDNFCANDNAMKWIGLRDYVCDGLTAISGVEAKFLASEYWERYLKDHVPTMTANNAPYGTAVAGTYGSGREAYRVFDGNTDYWAADSSLSWIGYKFTNPIEVSKIKAMTGNSINITWKVRYSDDGITWTDIDDSSFTTTQNVAVEKSFSKNGYHLYWSINAVSSASQTTVSMTELQFYGRSLNVSVPTMTSNTAPFGECLVTNDGGATLAYKAFDNDSSTNWGSDVITNAFVGYDFGRNVCIKQFKILPRYLTNLRLKNFKIEVSNDKSTWEEVYSGLIPSASQSEWFYGIVTDTNLKSGRYCRLLGVDTYGGNVGLLELQFYGLDYSEREFEPNTNKKWLYDHGLELETLTTSGTVTKGSDYLTLSAANSEATASVDLTDYSILRCKVGDHMSGTTQLSVGGSNPATATLTSANAPNNFSLGTSLFDQALATGVKMTANGICDITEIWVE